MLTFALVAARAEPPNAPEDRPAIAQLIAQLGSGEFTEREQASQRLDEIGEPAVTRLRAALKSPDLEIRFRARDVLHSIQRRRFAGRPPGSLRQQ
jgi:HEAT repeat protein